MALQTEVDKLEVMLARLAHGPSDGEEEDGALTRCARLASSYTSHARTPPHKSSPSPAHDAKGGVRGPVPLARCSHLATRVLRALAAAGILLHRLTPRA